MSSIFQKEKILPEEHIKTFGTDADGAAVIFLGRPRNRSEGKDVSFLEYEIYNGMARKETDRIISEAKEKFGITECAVIQRYGRVEIGEVSILIIVSSPHRKDSYDASRFIIDTIKERVPVWKKEHYKDGSSWITHGA